MTNKYLIIVGFGNFFVINNLKSINDQDVLEDSTIVDLATMSLLDINDMSTTKVEFKDGSALLHLIISQKSDDSDELTLTFTKDITPELLQSGEDNEIDIINLSTLQWYDGEWNDVSIE